MDQLAQTLQNLQQLSILRDIHNSLVTRMRALTRLSQEYEAQAALVRDEDDGPATARARGTGTPYPHGAFDGVPVGDDSGGNGDGEEGFIVEMQRNPDGSFSFQPVARARRGGAVPLTMMSGRVGTAADFEQQVLMRVLAMSLEAAQASQASAPPKISDEDMALLQEVSVTRRMLDKVTSECAVCQEDILVGSRKVMLPCTHLFCKSCIHQWLDTSRTCPICRMEMVDVAHLYEKHAPAKPEPPAVEPEWRLRRGEGGDLVGGRRRLTALQQALQHGGNQRRNSNDEDISEIRSSSSGSSMLPARGSPPTANVAPVVQAQRPSPPPSPPRSQRPVAGAAGAAQQPAPSGRVSASPLLHRGPQQQQQQQRAPEQSHRAAGEVQRGRGITEIDIESDDEMLVGSRTRSRPARLEPQRLGMTRERVQQHRLRERAASQWETGAHHDEVFDADMGEHHVAASHGEARTTGTAGRRVGDASTPGSTVGVRGLLRQRASAGNSAAPSPTSATTQGASPASLSSSSSSTVLRGPRRNPRRP